MTTKSELLKKAADTFTQYLERRREEETDLRGFGPYPTVNNVVFVQDDGIVLSITLGARTLELTGEFVPGDYPAWEFMGVSLTETEIFASEFAQHFCNILEEAKMNKADWHALPD
jgi:hypothetical protein